MPAVSSVNAVHVYVLVLSIGISCAHLVGWRGKAGPGARGSRALAVLVIAKQSARLKRASSLLLIYFLLVAVHYKQRACDPTPAGGTGKCRGHAPT